MSITFYREGKNRYASSLQKIDLKILYLLDDSYQFNLFDYIPRLFTITTNNGSYHFNTEILQNTSSVISEFLEENPTELQYHLEINDEENVFRKIEQMYQGELVIFTEDELPITKKFTHLLNIECCPNYMKPEFLKSHEYSYDYNLKLDDGVGMSTENFKSFIKNDTFRTFSIKTKSKEYKCNSFGVYYSKVIRDKLRENPQLSEYFYDYEDEFGEFQYICKLFNFEMVNITINNVHLLKEISEDLQIDFVLEKINKNLDDIEKVSQTIDENQTLVDSIEYLFELLYNIQSNSIDFVKNFIVESNWSKTQDDVFELAAFILQVIKTDFSYHSNLIDLLIKLEEEADETNCLNLLTPFIVKKLMSSLNDSLIVCSFVYNLYRKGKISREKINEKLMFFCSKHVSYPGCYDCSNITVWFLPELIELNLFNKDKYIEKETNEIGQISQYYSIKSSENFAKNFIQKYFPDKIELYKKMRDSGEPDDELTKALRIDDVDTFQSIIINYKIDFLKATIPFNIFEYFVPNGKTSFIDYAAAYGSIKCFKYLLLNHAFIDDSTFAFAAFGENIEIVKIVDQQNKANSKKSDKKKSSNLKYYLTKTRDNDQLLSYITPSIMKHKNNLFDWILQEKFSNNEILENFSQDLIKISVENGNAHSIIELIDKGADLSDSFKYIFEYAALNGFYKLLQLIWNINGQKSIDEKKDNKSYKRYYSWRNESSYQKNSFISFGNLSIFEFSLKLKYTQNELEDSLSFVIEKNYINIIEYFFDNLIQNKYFRITKRAVFISLDKSLDKDSLNLFHYLIKEFNLLNPSIFIDFDSLIQLVNKACKKSSLEATKVLSNLVVKNNENEDFTSPFLNAAASGSIEICQFLVDSKFFIDYEKVSSSFSILGLVKSEIFSIIYNNSNEDIKNTYLKFCLYPAIKERNIKLVEFLLNLKVECDNALIEASNSNDINMVNIILNYNNNPRFINKQSNNGTALFIAVKNDNLLIVKRLLSLKGINPNICNKLKQTPLILAISKLNLEIVDAILDFYGDEIQSQTWQLEKSIKKLLNIVSDFTNVTNYYHDSNQSDKKQNEDPKKNKIIKTLKKLLQIKNIDPNCHGEKFTILTFACKINEIELVQILLKSTKIDVNSYLMNDELTPLMVSIQNRNIEIAKLLIEDQRTDINFKNSDNKTALVFAVDQDLTEIVSFLIKNERFDPEQSELDYAFYISSSKVAKLLFPLNSLDVNFSYIQYYTSNYDGITDYSKLVCYETSLIKAVNDEDIVLIDLITKHPSFDKVRSRLNKAIFIAAENDFIVVFEKLIELVDNDVNLQTSTIGLFECALMNKSRSIITNILSNPNFDSKKNDLFKLFVRASTELLSDFYVPETHDSLNTSTFEILNELCEYDNNHEHLIDFTKLLPDGKSFFTKQLISNSSIEEYVDFFIDHGADPNMPDKNDVYPLEFAIKNESLEFVNALIKTEKIDFDIKIPTKPILDSSLNRYTNDAKYKSYLHLAARKNDKILNVFLAKNLIDVNITDDLGETPLMEAARFGGYSTVKILMQRDDIYFLHCNNEGEDALKIIKKLNNTSDNSVKITDKNEFTEELLKEIELHYSKYSYEDYVDDERYMEYNEYESNSAFDENNYEVIYGSSNKNAFDENYNHNYEDNYDDFYDDDD